MTRSMYRLGGLVLACVAVMFAVAGCRDTPESQVLAQYRKGEQAIADYNVAAYKSVISPHAIEDMQGELALAMTADASVTKTLRPSTMMFVIALRNRQPLQYLKRMSVDDYILWLMEQGFITVDADNDIYPYSVSFKQGAAMVQMGMKVEAERSSGIRFGRRRGSGLVSLISAAVPRSELVPLEGYEVTYVQMNGAWVSDGAALANTIDQWLKEESASEKMSVPEFILMIEQESHGSLKQDLFSPPK
ncbi:MAG: hypothetical protein SFY69_06775 [Planctomycetota bacterium]|nr:hypothetical protein [Planctomycetota bacterium]